MVVVVGIIGLIVGISFPSAMAGLDSVRMLTATDGVATFLNVAVNRTERFQQPVEVVIDAQEGRLILFTNDAGVTKELKLPDGVSIEAVLPANDGGGMGPRHILFVPGATVPGISIQLGNRRNAHRIVHLDPMTGFPRVENVKPE